MRSLNLLIFLLIFHQTFAQLPILFGETTANWKYYANTTLPQVPPMVGSLNWTSPGAYNTSTAGWPAATIALPAGYGSSYTGATAIYPSGYAGGNLTTSYYRRTITDVNLPYYTSLTLNVKRDDGVIVYLNGIEVYRDNMPTGTASHTTAAPGFVGAGSGSYDSDELIASPVTITGALLTSFIGLYPSDPTKLTITAEVHQNNPISGMPQFTNSSDSYFDLSLSGVLGSIPPAITRGPYLQLPTPNSMQVRWRTNVPTTGNVSYSSVSASGPWTSVSGSSATEHIVNLTSLTANTQYWYQIQNGTTVMEASPRHYFTTPPSAVDNSITTRIWVTGDASEDPSKTPRQDEVLTGFKIYQAVNPTATKIDLWMLLGDNAYINGSDTEYTNTFFNPYDDANTSAPINHIMKQTPILPCAGNHDYYDGPDISGTSVLESTNSLPGVSSILSTGSTRALSNYRLNKSNPFYDIFSMPANGGKYSTSTGITGKKAFYSYNHNNIHFVCLDSYGFYNDHLLYANAPSYPGISTSNPQLQWLLADLAANTQKWTILYWHHAPYTRGGGHFSDDPFADEFILKGIREKLISYLDQANFKIDLVLNGHSHAYERSKLLKGHHLNEATFDPVIHNNPLLTSINSNATSNGSFNNILTCPYIKSTTSSVNEGVIYVVTGSAGQLQASLPFSSVDGSIKGHKALNGASFSSPSASNRGTIEDNLGGSVYIEVKDNILEAKFINEAGLVADKFTIMKDVNSPVTRVYDILPGMDPSNVLLGADFYFGSLINLSGPTITGTQSFSPGFFNYFTNVTTPSIGPIYTIKDGTGCLTQNVRFHFTDDCWPLTPGLSLKNIIDSPVLEHIRSAGTITAKNTIMPNTKVIYEAVKSVNLEFEPPTSLGLPSPNLFEAKAKTAANQYFQAKIIPNCP
jgi:acid phosphatase type 7